MCLIVPHDSHPAWASKEKILLTTIASAGQAKPAVGLITEKLAPDE